MLKYLSVGYVLKPQGLKGEIKVKPLTDNINRFEDLPVVYLKQGDQYHKARIISLRYGNENVFIRLEDCTDRNEAEKLRGQYLWIPREMARNLPDDTYFIADLIGSAVESCEGRNLGRVGSVIHTGSNDVYVINGTNGEILIPALKKVVKDVNLNERKITVDIAQLEGLLGDED